MNKGIVYAASAYVLWGLLPIYWKALHGIPALEILAHRIVWSLGIVLLLLLYQGHWRWLRQLAGQWQTLRVFIATATLITINWFVYIWAVNAGYVVDASLGYFINPLVNVLLGVLFLRERLRAWQGVAIGIALVGVLYLTLSYGSVPWIAFTLAISFGLYGLLRKTATLNSLEGLTLETLLLFIPALAYLSYQEWSGSAALGHVDITTTLLLIGAGVVTAFPMLLFAAGARRITLISLGILQYIAPTLQFLLGVLVYGEPLNMSRLLGFSLIWLALCIYTADGVLRNVRRDPVPSVSGKL